MIIESRVVHLGVFWLNDPTTKPHALSLIERLGELAQVESLLAGGPVDHDWPAVKVDKSWDVAVAVTLRDIDACRTYFNEPLHQEIAGQLRDLCERVFAIYIDY